MPSTSLSADHRPSTALVLDTVREHRVGIAAWVLGGGAAMLFMGLALHTEMAQFPGGPRALADSVMPAVEAMRPLRWPAERLDTLGGYLTFHNITMFSGFLAIYAALQGARAVRGPEERHSLDDVLAAGWSRSAFLRDRALGFAVVDALIVVGLTIGVAWAMAASDEADLRGSAITVVAIGLSALACYALAVLVSQFVRSAKAAGGITVLILVAMYLLNNVADTMGPLGVIRYATPFHYANQSRALVPGHDLDVVSMIVLLATTVVLLVAAGLAFERRDCGSALAARARSRASRVAHASVETWWLRGYTSAHLHQHRFGLLAWAAGAGGFAALMMSLQPTVMEAWADFDFMLALMGGPGFDGDVLYTSFALDICAPVLVAYVITQAAGWVGDLDQGRVESLLSAPMPWTRLVWDRLAATVFGVAVITAVTIGAVCIGSALVDASVDITGLLRVTSMCLLLGWAIAAVAAIAVAALRSGVAVTILAVYVGAAYLLTWMIPIFDWPTWTERLSVFMAFGHPYQEWPAWGGLILLLMLAIPGSVLAAALAERTPKVGSA